MELVLLYYPFLCAFTWEPGVGLMSYSPI